MNFPRFAFFIDSSFCAPQSLLIARGFIAFIVAAGASLTGLDRWLCRRRQEQRDQPLNQGRVSQNRVAQCSVRQPSAHRDLHGRHDLGGADSKSSEA